MDKTSKKLKLISADTYKGVFTISDGWGGYSVEITQKPPTNKGFN